MHFPFTFTLNVPGLHNPFFGKPGTPLAQSWIEGNTRQMGSVASPKFPPTNALSPPAPLARKRGWIPSGPGPSHAAAFSTSTTGYLDTPAKYRDMPQRIPEVEAEGMVAELPPAKRRRTLAGSIVSTALSAALIGTAVGLTVYRLWRDRGRQPEQLPPPPPYQRGNWTPNVVELLKQAEPAPSPKARKFRPAPSSVRRHVGRHSCKPRARPQTITPSRSVSPAHTTPHLEPDYVHVSSIADDVESDVEPEMDEMDWIGDRLTRLVQEGQRALGRQIVVMSDAKEDEVDDGSDAWEEEPNNCPVPGPSISRRSSVRSLRRAYRPRDPPLPPSYSPQPILPPDSTSPRMRQSELDLVHHSPGRSMCGGLTITPRRITHGASLESDTFAPMASCSREDETAWQSPELRESMERARARYSQRRVQ